jgi:hypothetical protein
MSVAYISVRVKGEEGSVERWCCRKISGCPKCPVPMTPYFRVDRNTKHSAVITATVTKVMFSPVGGKTLKGKEPGRFGIRSVLRVCSIAEQKKP